MKKKIITGICTVLGICLLGTASFCIYSKTKDKRIEQKETTWVSEFLNGDLEECKSESVDRLSILDTDTEFSDLQLKIITAVAEECKLKDYSFERRDGITYIVTLEVPKYSGIDLKEVDIGDLKSDYMLNQLTLDEFKEKATERFEEELTNQLSNYDETTTVVVSLGYNKSGVANTESFIQGILSASNVSSVIKNYNDLVTKYVTTLR